MFFKDVTSNCFFFFNAGTAIPSGIASSQHSDRIRHRSLAALPCCGVGFLFLLFWADSVASITFFVFGPHLFCGLFLFVEAALVAGRLFSFLGHFLFWFLIFLFLS